MPSQPDDRSEPQPTHDATRDRRSVLTVLLGSLVAMAPWPIFGISLCMMGSIFEGPNDFMLLFGGVTLFLLIPLEMLGPPDSIYVVMYGAVWLLAFLLPAFLVARQSLSRSKLAVAYVLQVLFSATQAGLGFLLLVGRNV